jgi:hypothetical protein
MRNACIDVVIAELRAVGIYDYEIAHGGKHPQVHWSINGARRFYIAAATPSDRRAAQNARTGIWRLLREDGLLVQEAAPERSAPRPPSLEQRVAALERQVRALVGEDSVGRGSVS